MLSAISPKCFEHPWAQTAREAISKTQFYKPGPGVLAPGGLLRASGTRLATTGATAKTGAAPRGIGSTRVFQQRRNMLYFSTYRKKDSQKNMVFSFVLHITDKKKIVKV